MKYLLILALLSLTACNWIKQKSKDTVHKSGEVVAKAGSEFADGVAEGVEKSFNNEVVISNALQQNGLSIGKTVINSTDSSTDNVLSIYLIFDKDINQSATVKVYSERGQEYGRVRQTIQGTKGEAKYVDFVFDKRTNIDGKGKLVIE